MKATRFHYRRQDDYSHAFRKVNKTYFLGFTYFIDYCDISKA